VTQKFFPILPLAINGDGHSHVCVYDITASELVL
jgi:hypothetical protein